MRCLLFGDGAWAVNSLELLLHEGWDLVGVVVRGLPNEPSLEAVAARHGLSVLQPAQVNSREFLAEIARRSPDLNVSISYDQIFGRELIDSAPLGTVNFHAGKLPYYRGRSVINWAIINGETEIGLSAHYMDENIDTGDIIAQDPVAVDWEDYYSDVLSKVVAAFPQFVLKTLEAIAGGNIERRPQGHLPGTYFPARHEGDEWIDWSDTSRNIYNKLRGISRPAPGARTALDGRALIVWRAKYDPSWPKYIATAGQIVGQQKG